MDELEQLHAKIAELQKQAEQLTAQKKASVIADMKAKMQAYGITPKDLGLLGKGRASPTVKFRLGEHTWTGRGRQPKFVMDHLANGGSLDDLQVSK